MTTYAVPCSFRFDGITVDVQNTIKYLVQKNVQGKMDSYLKSYITRDDVDVLVDCKIEKNKKEKYEGIFRLMYDGKMLIYRNKIPFRKLTDLINHAFDHFKYGMSRQK